MQGGSCRVTLEGEALGLIPEKGAPTAFDLGDVDSFVAADYQLSLKLYTGKIILLSQFGKTYQNLCHDLLEAYRSRTLQCLLLEDLDEIERFDGHAQLDSPERSFAGHAELRLYKSNLAVLPETATGVQWRLAEIDSVTFDEPTYTLGIRSGSDRLILTKLAKRTEEFISSLQSAMNDLSDRSARILHSLFPFLDPDQFQTVANLMKEGRATAVVKLLAINSRTVPALLENTVDKHLEPYFDQLRKLTYDENYFAGFKLIRQEAEDAAAEGDPPEARAEGHEQEDEAVRAPESAPADAEGERESVLHWFFFPLVSSPAAKSPGNLVAWESTSRSGRATYFFRLIPHDQADQLRDPAKAPPVIEEAIRRLNHALALLNFRREPIYLPDESLERQPRYRRHAIACRRIPVLQQLRASYLGRALHTSPEAWQNQVQTILAKS